MGNATNKSLNTQECIISFLVIFLVVIAANLHAVFGLDMLWKDDNARYYAYVNDYYNITDPRSFIGFGLLVKWFFVAVFSHHSVQMARLLMLVGLMIPVSFLFYFFNRKYLHLSHWVSLVSAVLINIIPGQFAIPMFLDGSYPVLGMLFFISTLIFSSRYLQSSQTKISLLLFASITWLLVCDVIAEMGIFLFPVLIYFVHSSEANLKRKFYLYVTTLTITAVKLYSYFQTMGVNPTNQPTGLTFQDISTRMIWSIEFWLPVRLGGVFALATCILISILLGFALLKSTRAKNGASKIPRAIFFYGIWFILSCIPFWFLSKFFVERYFYIAYFGLTTLTLIGLYQVFIQFKLNRQFFVTISLVIICTLYGTQRYFLNIEDYVYWNEQNDAINSILSDELINDSTQIALINIDIKTAGFYEWSSGYLEHLLKKPGVTGIIGKELNFYDPFNLNHCHYSHPMSCLDVSKELIAFKKSDDNQLTKMRYFLQWAEKGEPGSDWSLYRTDESNILRIVQTGLGLDLYKTTLSELDLKPEQILWGDLNDKKSLEALSPKPDD